MNSKLILSYFSLSYIKWIYSSSEFPMKVGVGWSALIFKVSHVLWYFFFLLKSYWYILYVPTPNYWRTTIYKYPSLLFLCYTMKGYMKINKNVQLKIQISTYLSISMSNRRNGWTKINSKSPYLKNIVCYKRPKEKYTMCRVQNYPV